MFSTGAGKDGVTIAHECVNDTNAMARGAIFFFPRARTIVDVGAEEVAQRSWMKTGWDTQIAGAVGASLFGLALCRRGKTRIKHGRV